MCGSLGRLRGAPAWCLRLDSKCTCGGPDSGIATNTASLCEAATVFS